jgi:hypothetical protein
VRHRPLPNQPQPATEDDEWGSSAWAAEALDLALSAPP